MTLKNIKEIGLMETGWGDSMSCVYYDGFIQGLGQARSAIFAENLHYVFNTRGGTVHKILAPWGARGEANVSLLNGVITIIGGAGSPQDVWSFDPSIAGYTAGSWYNVNVDFTGDIGQRYMSAGADLGGWFYIFGGWGESTVYKTQDFITWTLVGNLPSSIDQISACGCCVHNGLIYLIGGATNMPTPDASGLYLADVNGEVWTFDGTNFALITTDKEHFGQIWLDAQSDGTNIYLSKGFISGDQILSYTIPPSLARQGNNRGFMFSPDGITWTDMALTDGYATWFERHRAGNVNVAGTVYFMAGFEANDFWKIIP